GAGARPRRLPRPPGQDPAGQLAAEHGPGRGGREAAHPRTRRPLRRTGRRRTRLSRPLPVQPGPRPRGPLPGPRRARAPSAALSEVDGELRAAAGRARGLILPLRPTPWPTPPATGRGSPGANRAHAQVTNRRLARFAGRAVTGCRPTPNSGLRPGRRRRAG